MAEPDAAAAAPRIRTLSDVLADQIAAGEVVERPASVVKELVENALDAGARRVEIDLEGGGLARVRVHDDGHGIHPEDLSLAIERHATSKIATLEDLDRVRSMGFRGEALPSIASVSRLTLTSRVAGEETAHALEVHGGERRSESPASHPRGTTVDVRDLFYNTPARRKFVRTERTELRHAEDVVRRIALARPEAAFVLRHAGRALIDVGASRGDGRERVARLCGRGFADAAIGVEAEAAGLRLYGWVGDPARAAPRARIEHLFVNERPVRDAVARHAVRLAYDGLVAPGAHPAWVLFLQLPADQVDVNVHPAKLEVRLREARMVHDFVHRALCRALGERGLLAPEDGIVGRASGEWAPPSGAVSMPAAGPHPSVSHGPAARERAGAYTEFLAGAASANSPDAHGPLALGVSHRRFAIVRDGARLLAVELDRAWAAVVRGRLAAAAGGESIVSRPLLLPVEAEIGEPVAEAVEACAGLLERIGIEIRRTGPASASLRRVPVVLADVGGARILEAVRGASAAGSRDGDEALAERLAEQLGALAGAALIEGDAARAAQAVAAAIDSTDAEHGEGWAAIGAADLERLARAGGR